MRLNDYLTLLKAGYKKSEIDALAEADRKAEELEAEKLKEVETSPNVDIEEETKGASIDKYMEVINNLANEVKELKTNIYQNNINNTEVKEVNVEDEAEKILASLVNPKFKQEDN